MGVTTERTGPTRTFFEALAARRSEPLLHNVSGTIRFEVMDDEGAERWFVNVQDGDVTVRRRAGKADCVVAADRDLFDRLVTGEANAISAVLRNELRVEGEVALLLAFQRLLPGPPSASDRDARSNEGGRR